MLEMRQFCLLLLVYTFECHNYALNEKVLYLITCIYNYEQSTVKCARDMASTHFFKTLSGCRGGGDVLCIYMILKLRLGIDIATQYPLFYSTE